MEKVEYKTGEQDAGRRIDVVLANQFVNISRSAWQQSLKNSLVCVDNQVVSSNYKLRPNQKIVAKLQVKKTQDIILIAPKKIPEILYQDSDVIIINKPAGLIAHPSQNHRLEPSVAGAFASLIHDNDSLRPGIVHRLDKDTSGVMVLARNKSTKEFLQKQFRERKVRKHYIALVHGRLNQSARIELPLQKSRRQPNTVVIHAGGRQAITEYKIVASYPNASLLDVEIFTGRTHQIRAHFAHLGHPVVGDIVYGKRTRPDGLQRQFLHASSLTILLPSGEELTINAKLPLDLTHYLETL